MSDTFDYIESLHQKGLMFDGRYQLIRPLNTDGGTADVWLARNIKTIESTSDTEIEEKDSGILVAIKIYRPQNALDIAGEQLFREEFKIAYKCRHENLLQPIDFSIFDEIPYLVLPYCKNGSSQQLIGKSMSDDDIWKYILDVSSGLKRLHKNDPPIIHQDIKPANILIDDCGNYTITDFGISEKQGGHVGHWYHENKGTLAYMAPERFLDEEPVPQSDIWAFGATLCEILTGKVPFGEDGGRTQLEGDDNLPKIENVSESIERLIQACLSKDAANRPSAEQIIKAAQNKQYPIKHKPTRVLYWVIPIFIAIGALFFFWRTPSTPPSFSNEDIYAQAELLLNTDSKDSLEKGFYLMDSLSKLGYIPAMYEVAFTFGWYSDKESVRRKKIMGIETYDSTDSANQYLPKDDKYTDFAVANLQKILDLGDSNYPQINSEAAYRLACYYASVNKRFQPDPQNPDFAKITKGVELINISREWAVKAKDNDQIEKCDRNMETIHRYMKRKQLNH